VWPVPLAQLLPQPQLIFPSRTWFFWEFIWIFSSRNHLKINIPHNSESKSYQINSIKSCSSRSFQEHQRHIPIPLKISVKKSFNIQELLNHTFKCHGSKPMHPSSLRAFQRHQEHNLKHPGSGGLITTKQNKLPCFIDRERVLNYALMRGWWLP
jgi:hypothetical protein